MFSSLAKLLQTFLQPVPAEHMRNLSRKLWLRQDTKRKFDKPILCANQLLRQCWLEFLIVRVYACACFGSMPLSGLKG